jgi:SprT protein
VSFNKDKNEIQERVEKLVDISNEKLGLNMSYPKITYDLKGTVAGQAFYYENKLRLNSVALKNYRDHFIKQTVGHEVAHLVAFQKHGGDIKPHGYQWANVMRMYKLPPDRCHTYDLPSARGGTRKNYACERCGKDYKIGPIKHNKWLRGEQSFRCTRCNGKVVWENMKKKKVKNSGRMDLIDF